MDAGEGFAPPIIRAYETGLLATLPANFWCPLQNSNLPPFPYQGSALPDELKGLIFTIGIVFIL